MYSSSTHMFTRKDYQEFIVFPIGYEVCVVIPIGSFAAGRLCRSAEVELQMTNGLQGTNETRTGISQRKWTG